jgi:YD repeat-containing protein
VRDNTAAITGNNSYNVANGAVSKTGLSGSNTYVISYWTTNSSAYTIAGTQAGYPLRGKTITINGVGWTYFEHQVTGQTSVSLSGTGRIDELRLYPANGQMTTYTYQPLLGMTSECDVDNRVTYYSYDALGRMRYIKDQDGNIVKTIEYHYGKMPVQAH